VRLARLQQKLVRHRHGAKRAIHFLLAANHDSHDAGKPLTSNLQQGGAVHFRHSNIGNDRVEHFFAQQIERRFPAGRECRLPRKFLQLEHELQIFQSLRLVVHEKNSFHPRSISGIRMEPPEAELPEIEPAEINSVRRLAAARNTSPRKRVSTRQSNWKRM
jgi:hypothetical protein